MQVVHRKRKNVPSASNMGVPSRGPRPMTIEGSRFEVLSQEHENVVERVDGSLNAGILDREVTDVVMGSREVHDTAGRVIDVGKRVENVQREYVAPKVTKVTVAGTSSERMVVSEKPVVGDSDSVGARTVALPNVAARGKVVAVDSTLPVGRHSAVRVVNDDGRAPKSTKERILPASIRGSQARVGSRVRLGVQGGTVSTHKTRKGILGLLTLRVEAHGFSGGIWVLWRSTVKLEVLAVSNQFVHALCSLHSDGIQVFVSFVYASPNSVERREGWGSLRRSGVCSRFNEFLFYSVLVDLGFVGPQFTWRRGSLFQRLDRCLGNMAWCNSFPDSAVHHLLRLGSDHRPIMLDSVYKTVTEGIRPFRYIVAWNDHHEFPNFLKSVWTNHGDLFTNISSFREASRKWSIDVFRHIGKRKAQLLARLNDIDRALESSFRPSLVRLEDKLKRELDEVLAFEESLWHQRSRITWTSEGDRNTSFYHLITRNLREHNTVRKLRVENDEWCVDSEALKSHAVAFFKGAPRPLQVMRMVDDNGEWDWHRMEGLLPRESIERIASVQPPRSDSGEDQPFWR
ncbi:hypothetical protein GQ457_13G009590 [Hibiscus cannabinus]